MCQSLHHKNWRSWVWSTKHSQGHSGHARCTRTRSASWMLAILVKTIVTTNNNTLAKSIANTNNKNCHECACCSHCCELVDTLCIISAQIYGTSSLPIFITGLYASHWFLLDFKQWEWGSAYMQDVLYAGIYGKHLKLSVFDESLVSRRN